jgi:hypothetical protein
VNSKNNLGGWMIASAPFLVVVGLLIANANWYGLFPPGNVQVNENALFSGLLTAAGGVVLFLIGLIRWLGR